MGRAMATCHLSSSPLTWTPRQCCHPVKGPAPVLASCKGSWLGPGAVAQKPQGAPGQAAQSLIWVTLPSGQLPAGPSSLRTPPQHPHPCAPPNPVCALELRPPQPTSQGSGVKQANKKPRTEGGPICVVWQEAVGRAQGCVPVGAV